MNAPASLHAPDHDRTASSPPDLRLVPTPSRRLDPAVVLGSALALCLATRAYFIFTLPWCTEDAYITFRYAVNWAHGLGPVYNAGEKAWGFTSPLWTSMLALVSRLGAPIEPAARWMLAGCDLVSLWMGWRLLRRHSLAAAAAFALFFAAWPRLAQMPATGLETSLVTCLLLATASLATTRAGGMLGGLLALSRPEGAAMSALLAPRLERRQRLIGLGVVSLLVGFMLYFGRLLPSSMSSKASVYGLKWLQGAYWMEWLVPGITPATHDGVALAPISAVLLGGLVAAIVRWRRTTCEDPALPLLLAGGLLTLFGYLVVGAPWYFWYAPTPMVAILLACCLGLAYARMLRWLWAPLAMFMVLAWPSVTDRVVRVQTHDAAVFAGIGETLRQDAAGRRASVLLEPIGIIGYSSGLRVIDEVGLVTPWVARERRAGDGWYARVMAHDPPDYIVIRRDWLSGGVGWAGAGAPFASREQADEALSKYEPLRWRADMRLPAGAGKLQILRRRR